jgi:lichenan operon transcriptional antiterminator
MNKIQTKILKILLYENNIVSSDVLANISGVTSKTVRKDIKIINEILADKGAEIKSKVSCGFYIEIIDEKVFAKFKDDIINKSKRTIFFMTNHNAVIYYIIRTVVSADGFVKLDDISNDLFINRTTISIYMSEVRKILNKYNLKMVNTPKYGTKVVGEEFNIRMCLVDSYLYYKEGEFKEDSYKKYIQTSTSIEQKIDDFINTLSNTTEISIPLMGIKKITLYIIFQINRIKAGKVIEKFDDFGIYELLNTSAFRKKNIVKNFIYNLYQSNVKRINPCF